MNSKLYLLGLSLLLACNTYYINPHKRPTKYHRFSIELGMCQDTILFGSHEWIAYQHEFPPDKYSSNWVIFRDGRLFDINYLTEGVSFTIMDTSLTEGVFGVWQKEANGRFRVQVPQFGYIYEYQGAIDSNQIVINKRIDKPFFIPREDSIHLIFTRSNSG